MVFKSLFAMAAYVTAMVRCAPTKLRDRQAPAGVPDYVLKYGEYIPMLVDAGKLQPQHDLALHISGNSQVAHHAINNL
jgi:hypothetical protein